jgi:hypothetical protein
MTLSRDGTKRTGRVAGGTEPKPACNCITTTPQLRRTVRTLGGTHEFLLCSVGAKVSLASASVDYGCGAGVWFDRDEREIAECQLGQGQQD